MHVDSNCVIINYPHHLRLDLDLEQRPPPPCPAFHSSIINSSRESCCLVWVVVDNDPPPRYVLDQPLRVTVFSAYLPFQLRQTERETMMYKFMTLFAVVAPLHLSTWGAIVRPVVHLVKSSRAWLFVSSLGQYIRTKTIYSSSSDRLDTGWPKEIQSEWMTEWMSRQLTVIGPTTRSKLVLARWKCRFWFSGFAREDRTK